MIVDGIARGYSDNRIRPNVSIVITSYNEGVELHRTLESIRENTSGSFEVIVVDDGSTDGSCEALTGSDVKVVRSHERTGVASSRNRGAELARSESLCFLDAHQRLSPGCIDQCVALAQETFSVVSPNIRGFGRYAWTTYGADFVVCSDNCPFSGKWRLKKPRADITLATTLRAPGYVMPKSIFRRIRWSNSLRSWGASEASLAIKAFFQGIHLLHFNGPVARHLFRRAFPYETDWEGVWLNHAIIAKVCFDEHTWERYWFPRVFSKNLDSQSCELLDSDSITQEHKEFQKTKVIEDSYFWTLLAGIACPHEVAKPQQQHCSTRARQMRAALGR